MSRNYRTINTTTTAILSPSDRALPNPNILHNFQPISNRFRFPNWTLVLCFFLQIRKTHDAMATRSTSSPSSSSSTAGWFKRFTYYHRPVRLFITMWTNGCTMPHLRAVLRVRECFTRIKRNDYAFIKKGEYASAKFLLKCEQIQLTHVHSPLASGCRATRFEYRGMWL